MSSYNEDRIAEWVAANPEHTVNTIARALGTEAAYLWVPLHNLVERGVLVVDRKPPEGSWRWRPTP